MYILSAHVYLQGRTSLFVAHRLSTIRNCDRIVVLSAGVVVEEGTHDQLMSRGAVYRDMWEMQAKEASRGNGVAEGTTSDSEDGERTMEPLPAALTAKSLN